MEQPANMPISADRWVACIRTLAFIGFDFTGADFLAQVRLTADAIGSPLVNLATVTLSTAEGIRLIYGGTDTITNHIAAGRLTAVPPGYSPSSSVALSVLGLRINETTMEGLPFTNPRGGDEGLVWDMHITPSGGIKDKYCGGTFTVRAGVTQ
jgi:hypothetical protein